MMDGLADVGWVVVHSRGGELTVFGSKRCEWGLCLGGDACDMGDG